MAHAENKITLTVGNNSMTATLVDNEATRSLLDLLAKGPVTINMDDYGGFEKVGSLPQSFPTSNTQITTQPGDIMLYQGHNMVIFYGNHSWSYTRLGKIDGATADNVRQFLGSGNISLTLSLDPAGIDEISADTHKTQKVYDLNGNLITARPLPAGIYIINGKKTLIK
ncbi:MAG: hypothetical protein K2J78_12440 [Muribaculaceae bacterium]|nr:hypothetical protein [Muribaculaceae bacterium]